MTGAHVDPAAVTIDWSVGAQVDGGWSVQLLPQVTDPRITPQWTPPDSASATIQYRQPPTSPGGDAPEAFSESRTVRFGLRIHRVRCGVTSQQVTLVAEPAVFVTGRDDVSNADIGEPRAPLFIERSLAPIPEPAVEFLGPLDLGRVGVTAAGPEVPLATGSLDIAVTGLDAACGDWTLDLAATPLESSDDASIAASNLFVVSLDNTPLPGGDCALDEGCVVTTVPSGPAEPASRTFTLGVSLVLPDQALATTFNSTLTATLTAEKAS